LGLVPNPSYDLPTLVETNFTPTLAAAKANNSFLAGLSRSLLDFRRRGRTLAHFEGNYSTGHPRLKTQAPLPDVAPLKGCKEPGSEPKGVILEKHYECK
jgi:hypothetical protein